jgi:hypothetical protein
MQDKTKSISEVVQKYLLLADEAEAKAKAIVIDPTSDRASEQAAAKRSYQATAANWHRLAKYLDPTWKRS